MTNSSITKAERKDAVSCLRCGAGATVTTCLRHTAVDYDFGEWSARCTDRVADGLVTCQAFFPRIARNRLIAFMVVSAQADPRHK